MPNTELSAARRRVVDEARAHVGTPYVHQHREKQVASDCAGTIYSVGTHADVLSITAEDLAPWLLYSRTPNPRFLGGWLNKFFVPSPVVPPDLAPDGSIAWMAWRKHLPMHLGIIATFEGRRTLIHSCGWFPACVEHALDRDWRSRVQSWWDFPGCAES